MVRAPTGRATWERMENSLFKGIPGYGLFRSLTQQLTVKAQDRAWKPAVAEIEEALVPAFIIEEHEDERFTVFVPSVPTPFAGAIYILTPDRVHNAGRPLPNRLGWCFGQRQTSLRPYDRDVVRRRNGCHLNGVEVDVFRDCVNTR